jgi:hypothetical protein
MNSRLKDHVPRTVNRKIGRKNTQASKCNVRLVADPRDGPFQYMLDEHRKWNSETKEGWRKDSFAF